MTSQDQDISTIRAALGCLDAVYINEHKDALAALDRLADNISLCVRMVDMTPSQIRLMCGELTANEMRCVLAVIGWLKRNVKNEM